MFYPQDRTEQRQILKSAWQKFLNKQPLTPLENQLAQVISLHPEYHNLIKNVDSEYFPDAGQTNPFLHINLHLALQEQLAINQPAGILEYYQKILQQTKDPHTAEHQMMECIAQMIFAAQKNNQALNHQAYISCLKKQCQ
ncbi:MAG: DUF1841 family protein [Candidatus Thioglobus sp.]|nr:DUF1841 family protein [Candidatus Thioglobus sp.]